MTFELEQDVAREVERLTELEIQKMKRAETVRAKQIDANQCREETSNA